MKTKLSLRSAGIGDIPFLWYLRNRPSVRKVSRNTAEISWKEHVEWAFPVVLGLTGKHLFVIEADGVCAGQVRFDEQQESLEVSISLLEEFQGQGLGGEALAQGMKNMAGAKSFLAVIARDNVSSQSFFEKHGFQKQREEGYWLHYIKRM